MSEKDWKIRLDHILGCIEHIERVTNKLDEITFEENIDAYRIVERNIEIIAEASKSIPENIKSEYSQIPWRNIIGTRNIITHLYDGVDEDILWTIVRAEIPSLKIAVKKMKKES